MQDLHGRNDTQGDKKLKIPVPKLKLEILPSFHGKSSKSINHSFLSHQQALGN